MLIVSRKENEIIEILPQEGAGQTTLAEAFSKGGIQIFLAGLGRKRVKVGIDAPRALRICRLDGSTKR